MLQCKCSNAEVIKFLKHNKTAKAYAFGIVAQTITNKLMGGIKIMKKVLSFILALALVVSIAPMSISATEAGTAKTVYFANFSGVYGSVSNLSNAEPEGIDYLPEKSTAYTTTATQRLGGWGTYVQIATEGTAWKDATGNASQVMFTVDLGAGAAAGWYQIEFTGGNWYTASDLYIYANDTYVGEYIPKKDVSAHEMGSTKTYGAVYLEPDADGKVEFKVAAAKMGVRGVSGNDASTAYWEGRILLSNLSLTYLGTKDELGYNIAHNIPSEIDYKSDINGINFSAYADAGDEIARTMNGIKSDRSTDGADSFKVEITEGDSVELVSTVADGVCSGTLVPKKLGATTLKFTATINGQTYTDTKTINVTSNDPVSVTADFTKATIGSATDPAQIKSEEFTVVADETGTYGYNITFLTTGGSAYAMQIPHKRYDNARYVWPAAVGNKVLLRDAQFTVKMPLSAKGYYTLDVSGARASAGSEYYVYADGKYAGYVSFYGTGMFTNRLNTLYLEPDEDETVKIMFATAANPSSNWLNMLYLTSISLTPVENLEKVEFESFSETLPEEVAVGTPVDFTVSAKMNDGSLRRTNGYNSVAEADAGNYTTVAVKSGAATLTKTSTDALCDGVYAGTLTASAPGDVVLTMTSCIDGGTPVSQDITVNVPYTDGSEAAPNRVSYIVRAEDSANNSSITVSDAEYTVNGKNVGEWAVDTSFTATATGEGFAYWTNGSGTPVSFDASYTFKPTSNFVLEAVYAPADTTTKKVQFWNYNKVYLDEVIADGETLGEKMPAAPSLNGYTFSNWVADGIGVFNKDTTLEDAITRVVAQFAKNAPAFGVGEDTLAYDDTYTDTAADEKEGTAFSYWTIDGQIASYNKILSFNVWNSVDVKAVYDGAKTAVPTVVLDKVDHTNSPDEYFIAYEVPAGYTAVDAGIVFSKTGEPSVNSADSKASVKQAGAKGQFTAAPGDDSHTVARGYVMYTDNANGALRVLYTTVK